MDRNEFNTQVRLACELLERFSLVRVLNWPRSLAVSEEFRKVALDNSATYAEIYKAGLTQSHYNVLLNDYSYFQFSHTDDEGWRLAYMPNPWLAGVSAAMEELRKWEHEEESGTLSDEDVSMLMDEMTYEGRVPPFRFEYARSQYKELAHPAAHFHIGRHFENRWPSAIKIGPRVFTMLILKMYHADKWGPLSAYGSLEPRDNCVDAELIEAASRAVAVHDFTDEERRSLHFGRNMIAVPAPAAPEPRRRGARGR